MTENFDTLSNTALSTTNALTIPGWFLAEAGTSTRNNGQYAVDTGGSNSGDTYSYGSALATDRALGSLLSGTFNSKIGACFTNNTGSTLNGLGIAYTGEEWRLGTASRADKLQFSYSTDATSLTTGTWTTVTSLDFSTPNQATTGNKDGNAAANRTAISSAILGLSVANGSDIWIRWSDFDASSADDGLAVDDFSLTPGTTPPTGVGSATPSALKPGDATHISVTVTNGAYPTSSGVGVTANLTAIGGSASQTLYDDGAHNDGAAGDNVFGFDTTVAGGTSVGTKTIAFSVADAQSRSSSGSLSLAITGDPLTISQVYGGGGNTDAPYTNDFIEIHNPNDFDVSLTGWTVQYGSSSGTTWSTTALSGTIDAGGYYLVQEGGGSVGQALPTPDKIGTLNMSAINGKVALVADTVALSGACPSSATIVDLLGYGTTNCAEGTATAALSNTNAAIRNGSGCTDTNNNVADFTVGTPSPRNNGTQTVACGGLSSDPAGYGSTSCALSGGTTLLTVTTFPGSNPTDNTITVTANLTSIGGSATQTLYDDGTNGDLVAGNKVFSYQASTGATPIGTYSIPATITDGQGRTNDATISVGVTDSVYTPIHDIQGTGTTSPYNGTTVTTRGIVTGKRYSGFYIQAAEADYDADETTSEAILVFTGSPRDVAVGDEVQVTGTVDEYYYTAGYPTSTEIAGNPSVCIFSSGNPLPAPIALTAADLPSTGTADQLASLEKREDMRVSIASLDVVAPTQGRVDEPSATSIGNGVFYGVVTGVARPFREPGVEASLALPSGSPCCVPRFDENPEHLRIDSDGQIGAASIAVQSGARITNMVGVLDWGGFVEPTLYVDATSPHSVSNIFGAVPVRDRAGNEFTVSSFNLERFFDDTDDPAIGEPVLTSTAYANRLNKASLAIRNILKMPDILGVEEVENLTVLQTLAAKISTDAIAAGQPDPQYQAYLEEGNDIGGIDVGFLVKTTRVTNVTVTQEGKDTTYVNPMTSANDLLNDRPPLLLTGEVVTSGLPNFPITVIVNHMRSLGGIADDTPDGNRVRTKRRAQAEWLANLVQTRQVANPNERIILVGDFNAFQFSDGYVDSIGTIKGVPTPADQVVLASSDLVNPDLVDLVDSVPSAQRYSYSFGGDAQTIDHEIVTQNLVPLVSELQYARLDADYPDSLRDDPTRPERLSDHDAPVTFIAMPANITATKSASPSQVSYLGQVTYTIVLTNNGDLDQLDNPGAEMVDPLPAGLSFVSANATSGTVTSSNNVVYWNGSIPAQGSVTITIVAEVRNASPGSTISNQATINYDSNGDGTNDAAGVTSSPVGGGATAITVGASATTDVPTASTWALMMLGALLAMAAVVKIR